MQAGLRIKGLCVHDLDAFDLMVADGECVCVSGTSGSGKSLILRAIADIDPHQGQVFLGEQSREAMPASQWRSLVMLLSADTHWWCDTVTEHFDDIDSDILNGLALHRDILNKDISMLSSGERQRLALLRVLSRYPRALLLDEPTANLDSQTTLQVEALLTAYRREHNIPVIWVSHDHEQIARVADRHFHLQDGLLQEVL